jgi:hypothetical protein
MGELHQEIITPQSFTSLEVRFRPAPFLPRLALTGGLTCAAGRCSIGGYAIDSGGAVKISPLQLNSISRRPVMSIKTCFAIGISAALIAAANLRADDAKTFKVDDEGFIRNWLVLGPISVDQKVSEHSEAACKEFLDKEYFSGQKDLKPSAGDKSTVDGAEMPWQAVEAADFTLDTNKIAQDQSKGTDNVVYLGVAYVVVPNDMPDVRLAIGSDDDSLWRVNGKELIRVYAARAAEKDTDHSEAIALKQGTNLVTFTLINGDGPSGICARFLDKDDKPVTGLAITSAPPK